MSYPLGFSISLLSILRNVKLAIFTNLPSTSKTDSDKLQIWSRRLQKTIAVAKSMWITPAMRRIFEKSRKLVISLSQLRIAVAKAIWTHLYTSINVHLSATSNHTPLLIKKPPHSNFQLHISKTCVFSIKLIENKGRPAKSHQPTHLVIQSNQMP